MFLSILIPSKRPEGLAKFLTTFRDNTKDPKDIEIIVLVDDETEYVDYFTNVTTIHYPPVKPVHVGNMLYECYKLSKGDWILFCNDDVAIDTANWDEILRREIDKFPDQLALFWPNEGIFESNLSCFPVVSRKVLDLLNFFPTNYRRYRIDDTLYHAFPFNRRVYIPEIRFNHSNKNYVGLSGNTIEDDDGAVVHDSLEWSNNAMRREEMKRMLSHVRKEVKVMIGASTGEFPRRADFYDYMNALEKPIGSVLMYSHERSPAHARNTIIQNALNHNCTHVLLIDDDHAFRSNALSMLLEHDVDIVTGLYLGRAYPHRPLIFDLAEPDGSCAYVRLNGDEERLKPIVACGFGFCLMKTEIFSRIEKPWVRLGELDPEQWCDDIGFFNRARKVGIKAYCDMECRIGHIGSMIVWPNKQDGQWFTGYDTGQGSINVPQISGSQGKTER
jgi:hypothetical protein